MAEIGFHDLAGRPLAPSLAALLEPILASGERAVVLVGSPERLEMLDGALWTYGRGSFLPHGVKADGFSEKQPIYLTTDDERPNGAQVLFLVDGADTADAGSYERVCDLFDGNDEEAVSAARARWKRAKDAGHALTYWQQSESGGWVKKAEG